MKKVLLYFIGWCLCTGIVSCKDFLEKYPYDSLPQEESFKTADDFSFHYLGVYSSMKAPGGFTEGSRIYGDIQCDLFQSVVASAGMLSGIYNWQFNANDPDANSIYDAMWVTIGRLNRIFDNYPAIKNNSTEDEIASMEMMLGDLFFIRAFCYSELVKYYCEAYDPARADEQLGMPIVKTLNHERNLPRNTLKETYDFMYSDLDSAANRVVRTVNITDVQNVRNLLVGTQAIHALRARLALYQQNYALASTEAYTAYEACEQNGLTLAQSREEYEYMTIGDGLGAEVIMLLGMTPDDLQGSVGAYFRKSFGTSLQPEFIPSRAFLQMFDDPTNDYRYGIFERQRLGYTHGLEWEVCYKDGHSSLLDKSSTNPAYQSMPKLFRMSELVLIVAEAQASMPDGDLNMANKFLNALKMCRIEGWNEKTYSKAQILDEVKKERAKELCLEGFRLADLKRWKMGFLRKPQPYTNAPFNAIEVKSDDPRFTWPIPKHEMDVNPLMKGNESNY
ncbi:RagB/SusD family nutrient uptake outer membrane protein [Butyricimonas muris]|uniref:RagB/SusD family nutrient uptake outer membrane protein n=1 Tax=Butyricimonas muris TaxID=3378067 RepID=UPI0039674093